MADQPDESELDHLITKLREVQRHTDRLGIGMASYTIELAVLELKSEQQQRDKDGAYQ